jgi:hypothetical protein
MTVPEHRVCTFGSELFTHSKCAIIHEIAVPSCGHGDSRRKHTRAIGATVSGGPVRKTQAVEAKTFNGRNRSNAGRVCALSIVAGDKADLFNCVELSNEGFGLFRRVFLCFYWMGQPCSRRRSLTRRWSYQKRFRETLRRRKKDVRQLLAAQCQL